MGADLLLAVDWLVCAVAPGSVEHPKQLDALNLDWYPASVPGTAAAALRTAGAPDWTTRDYDATDWWFRARFPAADPEAGAAILRIGGLATIADVWVNDDLSAQTRSMFRSLELPVPIRSGGNEIAIRCAALAPVVAQRRPGVARPRWRTNLVAEQGLRHVRTSMLGRMPGWAGLTAPVGPFRPVTLTPADEARVELHSRRLAATVDGRDGILHGWIMFSRRPASPVLVAVGDHTAVAEPERGGQSVSFTVRIPDVDLWWPHTHGEQARYPVSLTVEGDVHELSPVGFRTVTADTSDGGFRLAVNGVDVFARGACWVPPDPVALASTTDATREAVALARDADMNMLRVPGTMVYEDDSFFDACDELGVLVWQDCMLASLDPSSDPDVLDDLRAEFDEVFTRLQGRPALAVVCGGSEVQQAAAMSGADRERWRDEVADELIPAALAAALPDVPYVASSPVGGPLPFSVDTGVAHYFGVGAYLRPLDDARRSGVRFASECLAFAIPPEPATVDEVFGGAAAAGHHPAWKAGVPRDGGAPWDFDDVRDHYVRDLFGVDPQALRFTDPARYLELGRAAVVECLTTTFAEWRRAGSACAGGLVLSLRDLVPGAGWGLVDVLGRPKAAWYAARRVFAPVTLLATDEGLNGLRLHVVNDDAARLAATVTVRLFVAAHAVETVRADVAVDARSVTPVDVAGMLPGFRDITHAYRFGPCPYDAVLAELHDSDGRPLGDVVHFPAGRDVTVDHALGLSAVAEEVDGQWVLTCSSARAARWVGVRADGHRPSDSWFHLAPGTPRRVTLTPYAGISGPPSGQISAVNGPRPCAITVAATTGAPAT